MFCIFLINIATWTVYFQSVYFQLKLARVETSYLYLKTLIDTASQPALSLPLSLFTPISFFFLKHRRDKITLFCHAETSEDFPTTDRKNSRLFTLRCKVLTRLIPSWLSKCVFACSLLKIQHLGRFSLGCPENHQEHCNVTFSQDKGI